MAKSKIPNPLARRHQIQGDLSNAQATQTALAYLEAGRAVEAVDYLRKAGDAERLGAVRTQAIESGDVFLLRSVATAMEAPIERDEWRRTAEAAAAAGKDEYATESRRQAEREE